MAPAALVFAGKSVVTPAISFLVNKAFGYLNQYWNIEDVGEMEQRILNGLPKIQAVFDVVNQEQIKEKSSALDAWLWILRGAVEKAQDAVDEIEYYELKEKAEDRKVSDWGSPFAKMRHRAIKSVMHASIVDKVTKRLSHRGTLKRLKSALEGLDKAASGVGDFLAIAGYRDGCTSRQEEDFQNRDPEETGSMITAEMFGRHKEKEQVIGWLTKPSDADAEIEEISNDVSIVSIVGHGGMGKTTLAQNICEDNFVKHHFEKVIWACVSTSFNAKDIIRKILGSAGWEAPSANQLDPLQKILREKLSSLKFLLVLDDVWEDKDEDQWEKLLAPLRIGKSGSKILLTTRVKQVAELAGKVMRCKNDCKELQGLEEDDNIDLFKHHAFPTPWIQDYAALQPIGEQISRNLRGCPLVTRVVASDLRGHLDIQYWSNFLDEERLKHFEGSHADIMNILKLSYYHLPTEVQTCFRYCSIFPQDYRFTKDELAEMWTSSGLILQTESQRCPMDVASDCLHHLTKKSFFDVKISGVTYGGRLLEKYVMHDLMHDLAKCVSFEECARIDGVASLDNVVRLRTVRHVCFRNINNLPVEKLKAITSRLENLRTIIIEKEEDGQGNKDVLDIVEKLVDSSKSLRLFKTKLWHTSHFPEKLAKLLHLRFVEFQNTSQQESMSGVFRLYHLTTLRWKSMKIESRQVRDVGNQDRLRNLSYGAVNGCSMVPVGRLSSLRVLTGYNIRRAKGYNISVLKDLRSLQELCLRGLENVDNQEEAMEAMLNEKKDLKSLQLEWSSSSDGSRSRTEELILEKLEPPADLEELCISGFSGSSFPHWIAEPSVKKLLWLEFRMCKNIEEVPLLEKFQDLKHLTLYHLPRLERVSQALNVSGDECTEVFLPPCLRTLEIEQCSKLEELPLLPPSLEWLRIEQCSKLEELPLLPPSLERLQIKHVGLTRLPRIRILYDENGEIVSSKLLCINIKSCPNLTSLEGSLFEQKQHMGVLRELWVWNCVNLESAPLPLEEMNGLREMYIEKCPKLRMLRSAEDKLPSSSVETLILEQCGDLERILLESLQVFNNLRFLSLCNFSVTVSLPSADVFLNMKSLRGMTLTGCENLSSLGGLGSLPRLEELIILNCSKLTEAGQRLVPSLEVSGCEEEPRSFLKIKIIIIDHPSLLLLEPLKSLCPTSRLDIQGGSEMLDVIEPWLLQNCASLRYLYIYEVSLELLPASLRHLSNLKSLSVYGSDQLRALSNLPSSLESLFIDKCHPELRKKATGHGSLKWNEISHITQVQIGGCHFRNGEQYKIRAVDECEEIFEDPNKTRFCCSTALLPKSK